MGLILTHWPLLHSWFLMHSVMFRSFRRRSVSVADRLLSSESGKGEEEEEGMKLINATMMESEQNIFVTIFQALAASMIECCAV